MGSSQNDLKLHNFKHHITFIIFAESSWQLQKSFGINSFQKDLFEIAVFPLDPFVRVSIKCCAFHLHNAAYGNTEHLANVCVDFL